MNAKNWTLSLACALVLLGVSSVGFALDFRPFTPVQNVCPECEPPPDDEMEMSDGEKIRGKIVAENEDFYVMLRYGEVRAVPKSMIKGITWEDGSKPSGIGRLDQVLLKNGHVISGTIIEEVEKPRHMKIRASYADITFTVFNSEIDRAYKNGARYEVKVDD